MKKLIQYIGLCTCFLMSCKNQSVPTQPSPTPSIPPVVQPSSAPSPSATPVPIPTPSVTVSPSASPSTWITSSAWTITDITPSELRDKSISEFSVNQKGTPTLYVSTFNSNENTRTGLYILSEKQSPEFIPLLEIPTQMRAVQDSIYYMSLNCIKKLSFPDRAITVVAGVCGYSGQGFLDGSASQAVFSNPSGFTFDLKGNIFVADTRNMRVRKVENNQVTTYAGNSIATKNPTEGLNYRCRAGVCAAGSLYDPIEGINYTIRGVPGEEPIVPFISVDHIYRTEIPNKVIPIVQDGTRNTATFWRPQRLEFDAQGNLYVLDYLAFQRHIRRISPDGTVVTLVANSNAPDPEATITFGVSQSNPTVSAAADTAYPQAQYALDALSKNEQEYLGRFKVSGSKLYVLGLQLYCFDLLSGTWEVLINQQDLERYSEIEGLSENKTFIKSLATDSQGNLYLLASRSLEPNSSRNKILKLTPPSL